MLMRFVLLIVLGCSAGGDHHDNPAAAAMTMGSAPHLDLTGPQGPDQDLWRKQVLDLLTQLVQVQKETAGGQAEIIRLLGSLDSQGSQQILDLQNVARHQSLLVENHQALLLQTSRIASHLMTPVQPISQ